MEVKGKKIKKRYILVVVLAALIVPRCVQMNMEETALKEKLAAGGFDNEYEMENIVGSGFTTKAEFEKFVRTTPIPSSEGESTVQCAALAAFWEDRELSLKSGIGDLTPKSIRSVMNSDLIYDYAVGKTTNTILTARRDYLIKELEQQFENAGVTNTLKANYLECHEKFGPYVEKKCGISGDCDSTSTVAAWNFLLNKCVIDSESVGACTEEAARRGDGAGTYTLFFENRTEFYMFDPIVIPQEYRRDLRTVSTDIIYTQDTASNGVIVEVNAKGCMVRSSFTLSEDGTSVYERALPYQGSCTDVQRQINEIMLNKQERDGPVTKRIVAVN